MFKLCIGDIVKTKYGFDLFHRNYNKFKITELQSNGYACVNVCDVDISVQTAISYRDVVEVKKE